MEKGWGTRNLQTAKTGTLQPLFKVRQGQHSDSTRLELPHPREGLGEVQKGNHNGAAPAAGQALVRLLLFLYSSLQACHFIGKDNEAQRGKVRQRMKWLDGITDSMDVSLIRQVVSSCPTCELNNP